MNEIFNLYNLALSHGIIFLIVRDLTRSSGVSSFELFMRTSNVEDRIIEVIREEASETRSTLGDRNNDLTYKIRKIIEDEKDKTKDKRK